MQTGRPKLWMLLTGIALFLTAAMYAQSGSNGHSMRGDMPGGLTGSPFNGSTFSENPFSANPAAPASPAKELDRLSGAMKAASVPLSDAQQATILDVFEDHTTAMEVLARSGSAHAVERGNAGTDVLALLQGSRASIREALTEAQARVFDRTTPPVPPGADADATAATPRLEENDYDRVGSPSPDRDEASSSGSATFEDSSLIDANTGGSPVSFEAR